MILERGLLDGSRTVSSLNFTYEVNHKRSTHSPTQWPLTLRVLFSYFTWSPKNSMTTKQSSVSLKRTLHLVRTSPTRGLSLMWGNKSAMSPRRYLLQVFTSLMKLGITSLRDDLIWHWIVVRFRNKLRSGTLQLNSTMNLQKVILEAGNSDTGRCQHSELHRQDQTQDIYEVKLKSIRTHGNEMSDSDVCGCLRMVWQEGKEQAATVSTEWQTMSCVPEDSSFRYNMQNHEESSKSGNAS